MDSVDSVDPADAQEPRDQSPGTLTRPPEAAASVVNSCPKCGQPERGGAACARCGLLRSRWATFRVQIVPHPVLDPLWQAAQGSWEDPQAHQKLLKLAGTDWTLLSGVSQRYSQVLRQHPDDVVAKRAMSQLIEAAIGLPLPRQKRREGGRAAEIAKAFMGVAFLALATLLTLIVLRR